MDVVGYLSLALLAPCCISCEDAGQGVTWVSEKRQVQAGKLRPFLPETVWMPQLWTYLEAVVRFLVSLAPVVDRSHNSGRAAKTS